MSVRSKVSRAWACGPRLLGPLKAAWNPGWYWVTNVLCPWSPHQSSTVASAASTRPLATSTTTVRMSSTNRGICALRWNGRRPLDWLASMPSDEICHVQEVVDDQDRHHEEVAEQPPQ